MTPEEIKKAQMELEHDRMLAVKERMQEYDITHYYPKHREIMAACEKIGHRWQFSTVGPGGHSWYRCQLCSMMAVRQNHE